MVLNRVAVTGASGMVGRHLLAALAARGIRAAATSRQPPPVPDPRISWSPWDMRQWADPEVLDRLFGAVDALFHIGAAVPRQDCMPADQEIIDVNVRACRCLGMWSAMRAVPMYFLSGAIVYGPNATPPIAESASHVAVPEGGLYGLSKVLAEMVLENLAASGLHLAILRASSVYGWGLHETKMVPNMLSRAVAGKIIHLKPPFDDRINLIHAADVAAALIDAAKMGVRGVFNIAATAGTTVRELAQACVAGAGRGAIALDADTASRPAADRFALDCRHAARAFGFAPEVDLADGLRRLRDGRC